MKNKIRRLRLPNIVRFAFLMGVMLLVLYAGSVPSARAQAPTVILVPGTVTVSEQMQQAVASALQRAPGLPAAARYFAISDLRQEGHWALASIIGLAQLHAGQTWTIDDGAWFGLVLLKQQDGNWAGEAPGTAAFSALLDEAPDSFVDARAKRNLDPLRQPNAQGMETTSVYTFPWKPGTMMFYGPYGVHSNGWITGWKAVDMMSDGDTSVGHAPNRLLAAEAGTITYKCTDTQNVAIHLGDFFYTHLVDNATLVTGASFVQGALLGQLKTGSFNGNCGYGSQPANWFHVHWGFPSGDLHVEDWTLSMSTGDWTNGSQTVGPGDINNSWIMAGPTDPCRAPMLSGPADGTVSTSQTIDFGWSAVSGCLFSGYQFRIKTVATMDSGGTTIVDTISSLPSLTRLIPSDWNKQDLYWGVRAANAPFGASWSVGHFSIDPGPAVPTDYGFCADEWQWCAFSGTAQIYYGLSGQAVGPLTVTDGVNCSSGALGLPDSGAGNQCFVKGGRPEGTAWCASQSKTCTFGRANVATVYYGNNGKYNSKANVVTSIACNSSTFGDPFPGLTKACYYVVTGSTAASQTLSSVGAYDGTVVESTENSTIGGTFNATALILRLGDDASNRQIRSILSFNTSGLPDNAIITGVTLKLRGAGITGTNPFTVLGNILVDIRKGAFNRNPALQSGDFQAPASKNAVITLTNTPLKGWYSGGLAAANFGYINLTGATQFRLRFATDDNNNSTADLLKFFSGNYTTAGYRPKLLINYYLPEVPLSP